MRQPEIIRANGGLIDEGSRRLLGTLGGTKATTSEAGWSKHTRVAKLPVAILPQPSGDSDHVEKLQDKINQLEAHFEALQSRCDIALEELTGLKRKLNPPENESRKRAKTNVDTRVLDMVKKEEEKEVAGQESEVTSQDAEREGQQQREHGPFTGALSSKTKTDLLVIAQALQLPTTGTKREILERIRTYFIAHPETKIDATFAGLFISRRRPTNEENPPRPPSATPSDPGPPSGGHHDFHNLLPTQSFPPPYMGPAPFPVGPNPNIYPYYNYFGSHYTYY